MFRTLTIASVIALVGACNGSSETGDTGPSCLNSVEFFPADGTPNAYYRTTVEAEFDEMEEGVTLVVTGPGGEVPGTSEWAGDTLVFVPGAPLEPSTEYTATVTYSCGSPSVTWNTGEVGAETAPADLVDRTYDLDLTSGRFVQPAGIGSVLQQYIGDTIILMGVQSADDANIQMIGALGVEGSEPPVQEPCEPTIPFPEAAFVENPYFEVGPEDTTIVVESYEITIDDLFVSGAFAPDGSYIMGARLAGSIDTRPLVPLYEEGAEDDAICELAEAVGVYCEPCPVDNEPYCLSLEVDSISAAEVAGLTLTPIDDPCSLPECADDEDCQDPAE